MDQGDENNTTGLEGVAQAARQAPGRGPAPVHLWHPTHCGDIDIVIGRDGVWMHEGSPIGRTELVRLFSTILRKDPDGYHLVTPGEKMRIQVEDLPFRATAVERQGQTLVFTTDVGDEVAADADHPIVVETNSVTGEPQPAVRVRSDLWARITRPVFYELVEMAEPASELLVVRSAGTAFVLGEA
ncbi:DUF1285 domain-containing protein [Brevundimonas sp. PAMC22021]|uniref:DUF1285 domain-containing protein n=1 Tax=Brevundimonas sp. PAMC22021 TaxID=2861285 RepID=UPI001C63A90D|nr:DUF1285 domain-containing protein [Brevundimonas sp. PAMC22021]QYF87512.1 DUF1285 domain-containing protein [Brevundimonas sp. PAMC22021]